VKTLAAAWLCLVVLACASASKQTMATAPQANTGGAAPMPAGDSHAQIEELSNRIAAERQQMSLAPPTEPMAAVTYLMYADISDEEKAMIGSANVERLIGEIRV